MLSNSCFNPHVVKLFAIFVLNCLGTLEKQSIDIPCYHNSYYLISKPKGFGRQRIIMYHFAHMDKAEHLKDYFILEVRFFCV